MTEMAIASPSNPRIKAAARLRRRRDREETGLTIVDGARELRRALAAGVAVEEAFVAHDLVRTPDAHAVLDALVELDAPVVAVSEAAFAKVAFGGRSDGIVAVIRTPPTDLPRLQLPTDPLVVVLEGVEKPGNLGAVVRTADGAGADALVVAEAASDVYNPNAIRASLGTIFTLPIGAADTPEVRSWLTTLNVRLVAARLDAAAPPWEIDLTGPVAIVLGSEAHGLTSRWVDDDLVGTRIPMLGVADSLNVSVAAGILLYEARRQRT